MPPFQSSDIVHTASTDHRVIRPGKAKAPVPAVAGRLEPFLAKGAIQDRELSRDRGIALVESAGHNAEALEQGLALLESACADFPTDMEALEAWGQALLQLGRAQRAAEVLRTMLNHRPRRESALVRYATACEAAGDDRSALDSWRQAVDVNPLLPLAREHLVALLAERGAWNEVRPHADAWLRLDPGNVEAHKAWIAVRIKSGESADAQAAFARARALYPFNRSELQTWFDTLQP
jgi:tetratricopeptide (TPR) repeat protein